MDTLPNRSICSPRRKTLEDFKNYENVVTLLAQRAVAPTIKTRRENFVVYCIQAGEQRLAIRLRGDESAKWNYTPRLRALLRTYDVPRMEQLVAYSSSMPAIITRQPPGRSIGRIWRTKPETLLGVTSEQIHQIFSSIRMATDRGVTPDPGPENIFYDPHYGFSLIDSETLQYPLEASYVCTELALFLLRVYPDRQQEFINEHLRCMAKTALLYCGVSEGMVRRQEVAMDEKIYDHIPPEDLYWEELDTIPA